MKIVKLIGNGIAWGCTICMFILMTGSLIAGDEFLAMTSERFWAQAIGSIIVGIGFTVPSIIYEQESLSRGMQTLIHMGIGFFIYFLVAFNLGWIPVEFGWQMTVLSILIAITFAFAIWFGFYLYNKKEAQKLNQQLETMKK
ncbi:MAG: DUF3021 domain-containing protein [Lachnospiraceae bacterium]|nr:DUF3021 domain-containing protein [Lachnospiraceae bacterium]